MLSFMTVKNATIATPASTCTDLSFLHVDMLKASVTSSSFFYTLEQEVIKSALRGELLF